MRELWPNPDEDLDIAARLAGDDRPAPATRPWVTLTMITSLDGAVSVDGLSGGLGGPADHERFVAARRQADAILVGAGTVTAENYRPTTVPIAVVSGSISLNPKLRIFSDPERQPWIYTTGQAARIHGPVFGGIAEVINLGDSLQPAGILADLHARAILCVALEGGPTLNGHFLAADLVDEILLTMSPLAVGGNAPRLATGALLGADHRFRIDRVSMAKDLLFVRYLRRR